MAIQFRITDNSDQVIQELDRGIPAAMEKVGLVAEGYAKRECPVDTGNLRNSIAHAVQGRVAYIGTNVEYGPYVEMGTSRTRAQPFLRPAAQNHTEQYKQIIKSTLG